MNSSFALELCTTPPKVSLYAPNYCVQEQGVEILIEADRELAFNGDFYIIDSVGKRLDITLTHSYNTFSGVANLGDLSLGIATIYARVKDDVWNPSDILSKTFNILPYQVIHLTTSTKAIPPNLTNINITPKLSSEVGNVALNTIATTPKVCSEVLVNLEVSSIKSNINTSLEVTYDM